MWRKWKEENTTQLQIQILKFFKNTGKIDTPDTYIHDLPLSWLGISISIKSGRVKLVFKDLSGNVIDVCLL